jgi:hypothetical protein
MSTRSNGALRSVRRRALPSPQAAVEDSTRFSGVCSFPARAGWSGGANIGMVDAAAEQEGHPVGIEAPHQRADPEGSASGRDDLQPHHDAGLQRRARHDLRPVDADIDDLAGVAVGLRLDDDRPRDPRAGMLTSIARRRLSHGQGATQLACPPGRTMTTHIWHSGPVGTVTLSLSVMTQRQRGDAPTPLRRVQAKGGRGPHQVELLLYAE